MVSVAFLLLCLHTLGGTVRVTDLNLDSQVSPEDDTDADADCLDSLRPLLTRTSLREFFRPILDGTYLIREKDSGTYLAVSSDGRLQASSSTGKDAHWVLKRQKRDPRSSSMPAYTLKNTDDKSYLTVLDGHLTPERKVSENSHWRLQLGTSGKYYAIQHASLKSYVSIQNDGSLFLVDDPNLVGWELELVKKPFRDRMKRRSKRSELLQQLEIATDLPVVPGSNSHMTWSKICNPEVEYCQEFYVTQRERFNNLGLLEETDDSVVTEVKMSGLCDMHPSSLRELLSDRTIVQDLYVSDAGADCTYCKLSTYSRILRRVAVEECFQECIGTVEAIVPEILESDPSRHGSGEALMCFPRHDTNWTAFFEKVADSGEQCGSLPSDSLEAIAEFVVQDKCWNFKSDAGLLWKWNDGLPNNLDSYNHEASCEIMHYDRDDSTSPKDIFQQHSCPEGTACDCPETWAAAHETIFDIRQKGAMSLFVTEGSARFPSLLKQFARQALVKTIQTAVQEALPVIVQYIQTGLIIGAAGFTASTLFSPLLTPAFLMSAYSTINRQLTKQKVQWRCAQSVGCWPVPAERTYNGTHHVCRMGREAQAGGSPVWFLPPPGLQISMEGNGRSVCRMKVCSTTDSRMQRVGFQDVNVYNCQPLTFGDMNPDQKSLFLSLLSRTGVFNEYDSPNARAGLENIKEKNFWGQAATPTI